LKTKPKGHVEVVQDGNDESNMRDGVFQVNELVDPYQVAPSIDLEENLIFHILKNIFVDVEELNVVLSSNEHAQVDEDYDSDEINVKYYDGVDNESIEEEENFD
jgi:hypothetical protein